VADNTASLTLDGTGDYTKRGVDDAALDLTSAWTIECWFRPMDAGGWNVDTYYLISKGGESDEYTPYRMDIYYNDLRAGYRNGWTTYEATYNVSGLSTSVFHHFAATYSANEIKIYVDGSLVVTQSSLAAAPAATSAKFCVGAEHYYFGDSYGVAKACKIDEVRVWSVLRSGTEISDYKDIQATGSETNLVACYHFNSSVADATSNALNLTLVGGATYDTGDYPTLTDAGGGGGGLSIPVAMAQYRQRWR